VTMGDTSSPYRNDWTAGAGTLPSGGAPTASSLSVAQPVARGPVEPKKEQIQLAFRVVVLLSRVGPPPPDGEARPESTQQGMAWNLRATQGAISKVLRRLVVAGLVRHERHHVLGKRRRLRTYFLTASGMDLVHRYRERFPEGESSL